MHTQLVELHAGTSGQPPLELPCCSGLGTAPPPELGPSYHPPSPQNSGIHTAFVGTQGLCTLPAHRGWAASAPYPSSSFGTGLSPSSARTQLSCIGVAAPAAPAPAAAAGYSRRLWLHSAPSTSPTHQLTAVCEHTCSRALWHRMCHPEGHRVPPGQQHSPPQRPSNPHSTVHPPHVHVHKTAHPPRPHAATTTASTNPTQRVLLRGQYNMYSTVVPEGTSHTTLCGVWQTPPLPPSHTRSLLHGKHTKRRPPGHAHGC